MFDEVQFFPKAREAIKTLVEDGRYDYIETGSLVSQIMKYIAAGIKSGEFKSKSGEGYFVLKGEFFDAIKAGRKTTEYRDLTPRNLSKSIGIKTIKLQRGYGHPGQPPEQMRFEVASVGFLDANDRVRHADACSEGRVGVQVGGEGYAFACCRYRASSCCG